MSNRPFPIASLSLVCLFLLLIVFFSTWYLIRRTDLGVYLEKTHPHLADLTVNPSQNYYYELKVNDKTLHFNLVDPEQAPEDIREKVQLGWKIMQEPQIYAKGYPGNELRCTNCHFSNGNTFGGKNGSISLVGVTAWYPAYSERFKQIVTLEDRIDNCFKRSLNGKPLPRDSEEMKAIVAYLTWISKEVSFLKKLPWRSLVPLKAKHEPDIINGKKRYLECCAPCHKTNGEGMEKEEESLQVPALWGNGSYNDGAGMNRFELLAPFIYCNMPYQQPYLTEEEAMDIAQFLMAQKRPAFDPNKYVSKKNPQKDKP